MGITYGDHLIDSGYYDITPEQEREIEMSKLNEARARLAENLASFDAEVAFELASGGERADLWTEIDVNVEDLRAVLSVTCPHDCYRPGDCDGSCTHPPPSDAALAALEKIATEDDGLPTYTPQAMVEIAKRALTISR